MSNVVSLFSRQRNPQPRNAVKAVRGALDDIGADDDALGQILVYWRSLRPNGRKVTPQRRDLDILALKPVMGWTHILDCTEDDPYNFHFRLYGSRISIFGAHDFTKTRIADVPCSVYAKQVASDYNTVKATGCPSFHKVKTRLDWHTVEYTRLVLPFADEGGRTNQLLIAVNKRPLPELGELPW